jgi:hypothetical protein
MMLGNDITFITPETLPENYKALILKDFPKAFTKLEMSYYDDSSFIVGKTLLSNEQYLQEFRVRAMKKVLEPRTSKEVKEILRNLRPATKEVIAGIQSDDRLDMGCFYAMFGHIDHFTDILFAAKKMVEDGHSISIIMETC